MSEKSGYSRAEMCLAFLGGAAAGAVIALLSAPKSGRDMRRQIRDAAQSSTDKAKRIPRAVKSAAGGAREAFSGEMKEGLAETAEAGLGG